MISSWTPLPIVGEATGAAELAAFDGTAVP